jgi:hypothetical protein
MFLYLTLKLTMQGILSECNTLAAEAELAERRRWVRAALLEIERRYVSGEIDQETYLALQDKVLRTVGE